MNVVRKIYTNDEVSRHNNKESNWIIIENMVFDVTEFNFHPGGQIPLANEAGKDVTEIFYSLHRREVLAKYKNKLCIGFISKKEDKKEEIFSQTPVGELPHIQGFHSTYYTVDHVKFHRTIRSWIKNNLKSRLEKDEISGKFPKKDLYEKVGKTGITALRSGVIYKIPSTRLLGIWKGSDLNYFHEAILHQEIGRLGTHGSSDGLFAGMAIGIPPLAYFGSKRVQVNLLTPVLMGKKNICLAITEPYVGSDVANLKTVAKISTCKGYYLVNGNKKWITSGMTSDYFTTAVRTGPRGLRGISMLVIPKTQGVSTTKIKVSTYSSAAATSYIEFNNVKVPRENLLGKENKGFKIVVFNFNHERWMISIQTIGGCRDVIQECLRWSLQRKVFGKSLLEQPVIRNKLGVMIARLEATQHYADWITYQMNAMNPKQQFKLLGGPTALLKLQSTQTTEFVTSEACQIFGGRAITLGGMGKFVQRARSQIKNSTIYGGSEEIMADLGVRQLAKLMDPEARL